MALLFPNSGMKVRVSQDLTLFREHRLNHIERLASFDQSQGIVLFSVPFYGSNLDRGLGYVQRGDISQHASRPIRGQFLPGHLDLRPPTPGEIAGRFDELEIKSVAARLGLALDPETIGKSIEGNRLLSAMNRCATCRSVEDCGAFVADEEADTFDIVAFCADAPFLLGPHDGRPSNPPRVEVA